MAGSRAIDLALDLSRMPALAPVLREQALPSDLLEVIRIAAGCPEASKDAVAATHTPLRALRAAAVLYLEEMLFFPGAGLYRTLGVSSDASKSQMRLHMRWLLQWLHPDHNGDETAALLASRVIQAWRELGRREGHGGATGGSGEERPVPRRPSAKGPSRRPAMRVPWIAVPLHASVPARRRRRVMAFVLATGAALAVIVVPDGVVLGWLSRSPAVAAASARAAPGSAAGRGATHETNRSR